MDKETMHVNSRSQRLDYGLTHCFLNRRNGLPAMLLLLLCYLSQQFSTLNDALEILQIVSLTMSYRVEHALTSIASISMLYRDS